MSRATTIYQLDDADVGERWRALWNESPQRSPFSDAAYLGLTAAANDLRLNVHFVSDGADDLAACAVWWRKIGPYREMIIPPFTPFSPLLLQEDETEAEIHARESPLERLLAAIESTYHVLRIHLSPTVGDVRPAVWRGWQIRPLYTYMIDLAKAGRTTSGWSSSTARTFKRHRGDFDLIEPDARTCTTLCAESYGRSDRPLPLSADRLVPLIDKLAAAGLITIFGLRSRAEGTVEAAVAVMHDGESATYWIAGSTPGPAMTVLIGEMLPRLAERGFERFDFLGANTPSIAEFKRKFGCELVSYHRLSLFTRPELKVLHTLKRILR